MQTPTKSNKPTTGTNLEYARLHNRRVVLEAIRQAERLTRADLTRITSLTAQTISNIVAELLDESKLSAHAPEKTARGQPPIPLSINPDGGYSIGFHVEQHQIVGVLLDLKGVTRDRRIFSVSYPTFAEALPVLMKGVASFRRKVKAERMLGIGIALPGPFGVEGMSAIGPTAMPGWDDPASLALLRDMAGLSVLMENDATAAAMGERLYGIAGGLKDFAYLFVGHGLGAGLYLDNHLYSGHWRNAGEIGHVVVTPKGKPCYCGKRGCLERYVSGASLLEHLGIGADRNLSDLNLSDRKYATGIKRWLAEAAPALCHAVGMLESLLDPETILVGGMLSNDILERLIKQSLPLPPSVSVRALRAQPRLQLGTAGPDCVALGAAALVILAELSPDYQALLKA